ncbi:dimethyladenosine transferase [Nocardiopsis sp. CNR-923]|uniref:SRPBCC family protein n=1 Tax=Nocardiopsis sp. CNR-923 TaxID=1904965 RepID=UPI000966A24E|nr:SRPBCC family protein [Nocardiopsis sp. CNR-923]OLT27862.1 dimethyladenosine transferase [Nocardiopsis sp. CNR-923]
MATHQISRSITVKASAAHVFDLVASPARHAELDGSDTVRGVLSGPARLSPGSRFGMTMRMFGLPYRMTNRVVEFEQDRLIAWRHLGPHRWRYELEELSSGMTRVTETFDYTRGLPVLYVLLGVPARNAVGIERTLVRLRDAVERG